MHITSTYQRPVKLWLLICLLLIAGMVTLGGYTRLSGSGLSITEWKPIHGVIPPLSEAEWAEEFSKYQQIPQYSQVNPGMALEEFKAIFWPEFLHRLLGRMIGMVFFLPFLFFWLKKALPPPLPKRLLFIFALGGMQGVMGWVMVHSGLSERLYVSHIRLMLHLGLAFLIAGAIVWVLMDIHKRPSLLRCARNDDCLFSLFPLLLFLQILIGALLAGLHGGLIYNTFPDMNGHLISPDIGRFSGAWWENIALIQFTHRWLAAALVIFFFFWWWKNREYAKEKEATLLLTVVSLLLLLQFLLGVFTLLHGVPLPLALLHQLIGFGLFCVAIAAMVRLRK